MGLFITQSIRRREFGRGIPPADRAASIERARICLTEYVASHGLPKGTRLLKAYSTTKQGPRHILYLLVVAEADLFVLFYRDKQEKVGANMSLKNAEFNAALAKHLDLLRDDIAAGRVEEIS